MHNYFLLSFNRACPRTCSTWNVTPSHYYLFHSQPQSPCDSQTLQSLSLTLPPLPSHPDG
ncbi:hypothetical protein P5_0028 [Aeromonas phage P5]|nr:hypothetical protein P5_0028 [Aeromonas phage P5]